MGVEMWILGSGCFWSLFPLQWSRFQLCYVVLACLLCVSLPLLIAGCACKGGVQFTSVLVFSYIIQWGCVG
jgi:hypothetical protein